MEIMLATVLVSQKLSESSISFVFLSKQNGFRNKSFFFFFL